MFSVHSRYPAWRKPAQELKASDVVSSPKVLSIDTEPPQTVGLYVSQGLFPTKGVFTKWQAPVHDEEYNELKDPAAGLMFHLPMVKALRTTKGTWEIFFPYFMRLVASGPKKGGALLKSIDLRV